MFKITCLPSFREDSGHCQRKRRGGRLVVGFVPSSLPDFPLEDSGLVRLVFRPWTSLGFPSYPDFLFLRFHGILASSSRGSSASESSTFPAFVGSSESVLKGSGLSSSSSIIVFFLPLHSSASAPGFGAIHGGAGRSWLRRDPASSFRSCRRRAVGSLRHVAEG